jgi:hypothetical protein
MKRGMCKREELERKRTREEKGGGGSVREKI